MGTARISTAEKYNLPKFTAQFEEFHKHHPKPVTDNWDAIVSFGKVSKRAFALESVASISYSVPLQKIHTNIIEKLLVVFALVLELKVCPFVYDSTTVF